MAPWHYTIGGGIKEIITSGVIELATANVPPGERPAVWFSLDPVWEPTANKGWVNGAGEYVSLSKEETEARYGGLFRIEVPPEAAPYTWTDYKRMSGASPATITGLARAAREERSDPYRWRVSFDPVPKRLWTGIHVWNDDAWEPLPGAMMALWRKEIEGADVILGINKATRDKSVFFGRSLLEILAHEREGLRVSVLRVPLDFATDEPEWLAATCVALKGGCDLLSEHGPHRLAANEGGSHA